MRHLYQILRLVKEEVIKNTNPDEPTKMYCSGLCAIIGGLEEDKIITFDESDKVEEYLYDNRPKATKDQAWFWQCYFKRYRLAWLDKHLMLQRPDYLNKKIAKTIVENSKYGK